MIDYTICLSCGDIFPYPLPQDTADEVCHPEKYPHLVPDLCEFCDDCDDYQPSVRVFQP